MTATVCNTDTDITVLPMLTSVDRTSLQLAYDDSGGISVEILSMRRVHCQAFNVPQVHSTDQTVTQ